MSVKKGLLIALITSALILAVGVGNVSARLFELAAASTTADPHLGGEIVISTLDNEQYLPAVAYNWHHDEYLVVWHNTWGGGGRDIYAQRISSSGELISWFSITTAALPNSKAQPSVSYDPANDRYLVAFTYDFDGTGSDWDLYGRFIPWDGPSASLTEFPICAWTTHQWNPKVAYAWTQQEFLVVWANEYQAGSPPMYISGRRVKASDGSFPGGTGSDFTISDGTQNRVNPDVAYNLARNEYLVVYDNALDVFATRFTGSAASLAGGEFAIAAWPGAETLPSVDACRETDQYLVAWQNDQPDIYTRFISGDGSLDGGPLQLDSTSIDEIEPQVTCNAAGNQFLAVWQQQFSSTTGPYGIRGQFVNNDKSLGAVFGIMNPTSGVTAEFTTPAVAGGNVNYLTVWEHDRAGTFFQDIHGRLITPYTVFLPLILRNH